MVLVVGSCSLCCDRRAGFLIDTTQLSVVVGWCAIFVRGKMSRRGVDLILQAWSGICPQADAWAGQRDFAS